MGYVSIPVLSRCWVVKPFLLLSSLIISFNITVMSHLALVYLAIKSILKTLFIYQSEIHVLFSYRSYYWVLNMTGIGQNDP